MAEVRFENALVRYRGGAPVLSQFSWHVPEGSFAAVIGPNASGKSTLLRTLAGLLSVSVGRLSVDGDDPSRLSAKSRARRIAYLPQSEPVDVPFTVLELVLQGRYAFQGFLPFDRAQDFARAEECLRAVEAWDLRSRLLTELSGGERQRAQLARALAQEPKLLLLDEPAAALDLRHQVATYRLLGSLHTKNRLTIVVVSHDLNLPAAHADTILVMKNGRAVAAGHPDEILRASMLCPIFETEITEMQDPITGRRVLTPTP